MSHARHTHDRLEWTCALDSRVPQIRIATGGWIATARDQHTAIAEKRGGMPRAWRKSFRRQGLERAGSRYEPFRRRDGAAANVYSTQDEHGAIRQECGRVPRPGRQRRGGEWRDGAVRPANCSERGICFATYEQHAAVG